MGELKGMRNCVCVLVTQAVLLAIILIIGAFILWFANFGSVQSRFMNITGIFLVGFGTTLSLSAIWQHLLNFIEDWWSIVAIKRVQNWLLRPLYAATGLALLSGIGFAITANQYSLETISTMYSRVLPSALLVLTIGIPLLATSALILAGGKRIAALKNNLKLMQASRGDIDNQVMKRIHASIDSENGVGETFARPAPKGFYFAGLTSKPWHESMNFDWVAGFENAYDDVVAEAKATMTALGDNIEHYGYQGLDTTKWKRVSLVANRTENIENLAACPVTASLLKTIPGYPMFRDAMFSILEPGGVITPHRDYGNLFLTMHFGLIIPPEGFLEVANMRHEWQAGKALVFDSSYNHQAVNLSDAPRVILLVDFPNPDLSECERQWVLDAPFWKA